jgi:integrase
MQWSEDNETLLTIPAERMKGDRSHEVPLPPAAAGILASLRPFDGGDYVFTTTNGAKPINGFGKAKIRIDKLSGVSGWVIHDLRRTARTHFSALPVDDRVRELVIAHAQPGLHKVYDLHTYQEEKRRCLELWEKRLFGIVELAPTDVADLSEERAKRASVQAGVA